MDSLAPIHHSGWYLSPSPRKVTSKPATKWNISYLLDFWLGILSVDGLHMRLLGAPIYLSPIELETIENSWGLFRIYRELLRKIQCFGSIYVFGDIMRIKTITPLLVTRDNNTGSKRTLKRQERDSNNSMQQIRLLWFTIVVDTLAQHQGRSLPSQPLSEIFLTLWIVYLVFFLLTVCTCDCFARLSTFLWLV